MISGLNALQGKKQILEQIKTETVDAIEQPWKIELANLQNQINELKNQANVDKIYPIGSIYMSVKNENPSELFGGTWEAWGSGRVPVGVDTTQTEFVTVEKTGGVKTVNLNHSHTTADHILTVAEIPPHTHNIRRFDGATPVGTDWALSTSYVGYSDDTWLSRSTGGGKAHNHGPTGSSLSSTQSILQPYITCYMWKRTA